LAGSKLKYYNFVRTASLFFALVIAFWIPSYRWVLSDFIVLWLLFSVLEFQFKKRFKQNLKSRFKILSITIQLLLFTIVLSEIFFTEDKKIITKNIVQKLSLLVFPLLFSLSGTDFKPKKDLFLKLFVLSNLIMSLICLGVALYHSLSFYEGKILFEPHYLSYRNYFTQSDLSVFHHRSYFSMYIVFALAILFYLDEKYKIFARKKRKFIYWFLILFFSLMVFLMSSRAGLLSLLILFSVQIIRKIYFSKNIFYKIPTVIVIAFMFVFVFTNKRMKITLNRMITIEHNKSSEKIIKNSPRIYLWKTSAELIKENFPGGIGAEQFQSVFNKKYSEISGRDINDIKKQNLNVHNQFLEEFVLYGIFGFLLLSAIFVYPIIISFKRKNYLFLSFLLITGFNFLFESMLNTIAGIIFFAFFFNYFIFVFEEEDKKVILSDI